MICYLTSKVLYASIEFSPSRDWHKAFHMFRHGSDVSNNSNDIKSSLFYPCFVWIADNYACYYALSSMGLCFLGLLEVRGLHSLQGSHVQLHNSYLKPLIIMLITSTFKCLISSSVLQLQEKMMFHTLMISGHR